MKLTFEHLCAAVWLFHGQERCVSAQKLERFVEPLWRELAKLLVQRLLSIQEVNRGVENTAG